MAHGNWRRNTVAVSNSETGFELHPMRFRRESGGSCPFSCFMTHESLPRTITFDEEHQENVKKKDGLSSNRWIDDNVL